MTFSAGTSNWTTRPWLGFDTETTGVNVSQDRLVTAALVLRGLPPASADQDQVSTWLADPGVPIPVRAQRVHGISTEFARTHGQPINQVLNEVASAIVDHWMEQLPLVAFNASFDITLLNAELSRHGLGSLEERMGGDIGPVLDPLVLDRMCDPYRPGKRTLSDMVAVYGVTLSPHAHSADADVMMTLDLLAAILDRYPTLAQTSLAELQRQQAEGHRKWAISFEQFLQRNGRQTHIPKSWPQL